MTRILRAPRISQRCKVPSWSLLPCIGNQEGTLQHLSWHFRTDPVELESTMCWRCLCFPIQQDRSYTLARCQSQGETSQRHILGSHLRNIPRGTLRKQLRLSYANRNRLDMRNNWKVWSHLQTILVRTQSTRSLPSYFDSGQVRTACKMSIYFPVG